MTFDTDKDFFEYIQEDSRTLKQFANHMSTYSQGRPSWMDNGFYSVQERLLEGQTIEFNDPLLVDVGGSTGHDISEFRAKWPHAPGRLILQDRPEVIAKASTLNLHPLIEPMAHDFFTVQPVKGTYMEPFLPSPPKEMKVSIANDHTVSCASVLYALCSPRLARRGQPSNSRQYSGCHEAGIQQDAHQ